MASRGDKPPCPCRPKTGIPLPREQRGRRRRAPVVPPRYNVVATDYLPPDQNELVAYPGGSPWAQSEAVQDAGAQWQLEEGRARLSANQAAQQRERVSQLMELAMPGPSTSGGYMGADVPHVQYPQPQQAIQSSNLENEPPESSYWKQQAYEEMADHNAVAEIAQACMRAKAIRNAESNRAVQLMVESGASREVIEYEIRKNEAEPLDELYVLRDLIEHGASDRAVAIQTERLACGNIGESMPASATQPAVQELYSRRNTLQPRERFPAVTNGTTAEAENMPGYSQTAMENQSPATLLEGNLPPGGGQLEYWEEQGIQDEADLLDLTCKVARRHVEEMTPPERYNRRKSLGLPSRPSYLRQSIRSARPLEYPRPEDEYLTSPGVCPAVVLTRCSTQPAPDTNITTQNLNRLSPRKRVKEKRVLAPKRKKVPLAEEASPVNVDPDIQEALDTVADVTASIVEDIQNYAQMPDLPTNAQLAAQDALTAAVDTATAAANNARAYAFGIAADDPDAQCPDIANESPPWNEEDRRFMDMVDADQPPPRRSRRTSTSSPGSPTRHSSFFEHSTSLGHKQDPANQCPATVNEEQYWEFVNSLDRNPNASPESYQHTPSAGTCPATTAAAATDYYPAERRSIPRTSPRKLPSASPRKLSSASPRKSPRTSPRESPRMALPTSVDTSLCKSPCSSPRTSLDPSSLGLSEAQSVGDLVLDLGEDMILTDEENEYAAASPAPFDGRLLGYDELLEGEQNENEELEPEEAPLQGENNAVAPYTRSPSPRRRSVSYQQSANRTIGGRSPSPRRPSVSYEQAPNRTCPKAIDSSSPPSPRRPFMSYQQSGNRTFPGARGGRSSSPRRPSMSYQQSANRTCPGAIPVDPRRPASPQILPPANVSLRPTPTGRYQELAGTGNRRRKLSASSQRRLYTTPARLSPVGQDVKSELEELQERCGCSPKGTDQSQRETSRMKTMLEGEGSDDEIFEPNRTVCPCPGTGALDYKHYEEMLRKEARDVSLALQLGSSSRGPTSICTKETAPGCRLIDMGQEDLPVSLAAQMVYAGEEGLTMSTPPDKLFNRLFPDCQDELLLNVSAASRSPKNVVVPISEVQDIALGTMMEDAVLVASVVRTEPIRPSHSLFNDTVGGASLNISNLWKTKEKSINEESIRSNLADISIGAGHHPPDPRSPGTSLGTTRHGLSFDGSEFYLDRVAPAHHSFIQLRGTTPPSWFPGFMSALPAHHPDVVVLSSRPSEVLHTAWATLNPDTFTQDCIQLVR